MPGHRLKRDPDWDTGEERDPYEMTPEHIEALGETIAEGLISEGVDIFALSASFCNGPECSDCGKVSCWHHDPNWVLEPCPAR